MLLSNSHCKNLLGPWSEKIELLHRKGAICTLSLTELWCWLLTTNQFITDFNQRWWISRQWLHFTSQEAGLLWRCLLWQCWKKLCKSPVTWPLTPRNRPVPAHCLCLHSAADAISFPFNTEAFLQNVQQLWKAWENILFGFKLLYQATHVRLVLKEPKESICLCAAFLMKDAEDQWMTMIKKMLHR